MFQRFFQLLASLEVWIVGLFACASMVSARLLPVTAGVAAAFWILRLLASRKLTIRTPVDFPILLIALMIPVTLWATALPEITQPQVYRLLVGIALFYAVANWTDTPARLNHLVTVTILAGLVLALSAPVSVEWSVGKLPFIPESLYQRFPILVADTIHPNVMAGSLVVLLPIVMATLAFSSWRAGLLKPILSGIALIAMAGVLVLTASRGAWIAFAAALLLLAVLRWRKGWVVLVLAAITGAAGIAYFGITPILETLSRSSTVGSIEGRVEIWSRAIYMVQDFPFTGIGLGSFGQVADVLYPFFLAEPGSVPHAHNLFLQVAVDTGIPGLIAWLAVLGLAATSAWQVYRCGRNHGQGLIAGLGAGLLCSQVALVIHGLTDAVTWGMVRPAPLIWMIWGLSIAAGNIYAKESQRVPSTEPVTLEPRPVFPGLLSQER